MAAILQLYNHMLPLLPVQITLVSNTQVMFMFLLINDFIK